MCGTRRLRDNLIDSIIWYSVIELLSRDTNRNILNARIVILIKINLFERKEPEMRRVHLNFSDTRLFRPSKPLSSSVVPIPIHEKKNERRVRYFPIFFSNNFITFFFIRFSIFSALGLNRRVSWLCCTTAVAYQARSMRTSHIIKFSMQKQYFRYIFFDSFGTVRVEGPPPAYTFYQRSNRSCVNGLRAASHTKF